MILPSEETSRPGQIAQQVVRKRVEVSGESLVDAQPTYQENQPVVSFRFDSVGARKFGNVTRDHVGELLAIVLDDKVISSPRIREPILGGSGIISGSFTVEFGQRARGPAARRRPAGAARHRRGAHRRPGSRGRFDRGGQVGERDRADSRDGFMALYYGLFGVARLRRAGS